MAKEWIEGRLGYNQENDRYGLLVSDLWENYGFHCGEPLQIEIDGKWIDTTFEMDWSSGKGIWYLKGTGIKGTDIEYVWARIFEDVR